MINQFDKDKTHTTVPISTPVAFVRGTEQSYLLSTNNDFF